MDKVKDIIEWIGYILALIGFIATVYKTSSVWINLKRFSWSDVDKYSKKVIEKIADDMFVPDIVVCIGRGGSIFGSILSGNIKVPEHKMHNITILGIDRIYKWENGERQEVKNKLVDLTFLEGKKVLLVAGDIMTGGTMKVYLHQIEKTNPLEIRTACLVKGVASIFEPDYFGKEISANFDMPWMYKGFKYIRDSRKEE